MRDPSEGCACVVGVGEPRRGDPTGRANGSAGENLGSKLILVPKISGSLKMEMNKEFLNRNEFQEVSGIGSTAKGLLPVHKWN